ncbi:MAG TPA: S41 family peptidase [Thermoanaerobaculia bacterium]|jgi:C-terminal processing protease CtpA/Prc|nr:S41 family peptidase [Thermoanaerobaculia bacterium]
MLIRSRISRSLLALFAFLAALSFPFAARPAEPGPPLPQTSIQRLTQVGKLWGKIRYLHPYLAYREDLDWDAALVAALPKIQAAKSTAEYRTAVSGLLAALGDPITRVLAAPKAPGSKPAAAELFRELEGGALAIDLGPRITSAGMMDVYRQIGREAPKVAAAREVVIDLRKGSSPDDPVGDDSFVIETIAGALASRPCRAPAERYLMHSGFAGTSSTSGGYYSGFLEKLATVYRPDPELKPVAKKVAFVVDRTILLPALALALQACGDGWIVAVGGVSEETGATTIEVDLGEDLTAQVRVSEGLPLGGGPTADVVMPEAEAGRAAEAALAALRAERPARRETPPRTLPGGVQRADPAYREMIEPDLPHRQLAVIRAWNVIALFYPYRHLIGDWDAVLPEFLARMETAASGKDYALGILQMMNRVTDGHTGVYGHPALAELFGTAVIPARVRWVEGAAVITHIGEDARKAGLAPGDAIRAIDGEAMAAAMERLRPLYTASTEAALRSKLVIAPLLGPAGSTVRLTLEGIDGKTKEVTIARDPDLRGKIPPRVAGEVIQILPGNFGYVDLVRLSTVQVDGMFDTVKNTRGLIFDMRGYPQGTAWSIAPRINTKHAKFGAQFRRSQVSALSAEEADAGFYFSQPLPLGSSKLPLYDKPIAMIIDDRAISQSEHSGLFFEAASDIHFVGEPTAGANGDVTSFNLPGGIQVYFTGHDVRHADGRQLQRIGLVPDVPVSPTRAGLAAGRDELLEAAVKDLEGRAAPAVKP